MILYVDSQFASPYAMSAFMALRIKQQAFGLRTLKLNEGEQSTSDYSARSLTSRVPTIVEGDFSLSESSAIAEYLDETFDGPRLYPEDRRDRARARQLQAWLRSDLAALKQERSTEVIFYRPADAPLSASALSAATKLLRVAASLIDDGRKNLFRDWCIADTDLALMLCRLVLNGDRVPTRLETYAREQLKHPAAKEWLAMPRPPLDDA